MDADLRQLERSGALQPAHLARLGDYIGAANLALQQGDLDTVWMYLFKHKISPAELLKAGRPALAAHKIKKFLNWSSLRIPEAVVAIKLTAHAFRAYQGTVRLLMSYICMGPGRRRVFAVTAVGWPHQDHISFYPIELEWSPKMRQVGQPVLPKYLQSAWDRKTPLAEWSIMCPGKAKIHQIG